MVWAEMAVDMDWERDIGATDFGAVVSELRTNMGAAFDRHASRQDGLHGRFKRD